MRRQYPIGPGYKAKVKYLGEIKEVIGPTELEHGSIAWIPWEMAKVFADRVEILEYEQALVDTMKGHPVTGDPDDLPGFVCMECWENGELAVFRNYFVLTGHIGSHRPGHGWPKGRPRKPQPEKKLGRPRGTTREVMAKRHAKEERRRHRAERQAGVSSNVSDEIHGEAIQEAGIPAAG